MKYIVAVKEEGSASPKIYSFPDDRSRELFISDLKGMGVDFDHITTETVDEEKQSLH